ncbi:TIGR03560 family F420-dependent LLM class oxidoreductase [Candidatus Bathyarchaeota archaeon]|nr:TIGR03560 family F420-dependent LLM class oxidoreductase [Candidatus Bathyarchaeota archaeon]
MFKTPMFGVHHQPEGRDWNHMKKAVHLVEDSGFDLFTVTDHFMNMADPEGPYNHPLEAWTLLAALAAETSKIRLSPLVSCYGYRRPTVLAKMATTVDIISGGRLIFGIGGGWHEAEFKGFMGKYPSGPRRLTGLKETIEIAKGMFTHERFSYDGKLYKVDNVLNSPQPIQKPIPIMVGGGGEQRTMRYAARYADISHFFINNLDQLKHKLQILKKHCKREGTDYDRIVKGTTFRVVLGSEKEINAKIEKRAKEYHLPVEPMKNRLGLGAGKPSDVADRFKELFDNGLGLVTLSFIDMDDIPVFAEEVISQFR